LLLLLFVLHPLMLLLKELLILLLLLKLVSMLLLKILILKCTLSGWVRDAWNYLRGSWQKGDRLSVAATISYHLC
jgi:hypothetical protein